MRKKMKIDEYIVKLVFERWNISEQIYSKYSFGKIGNIYVDKKLEKCIKILENPLEGYNLENIKDIIEEKKEIIHNFFDKDYIVKILKVNGKYYDIFESNNKIIISYFMEFIDGVNLNIIENGNINYANLKGCIECIKKFHDDSSQYDINCQIDWKDDYNSVYKLCSDENLKIKMNEYYDYLISKKEECIIHGDLNKRNLLCCENVVLEYLLGHEILHSVI